MQRLRSHEIGWKLFNRFMTYAHAHDIPVVADTLFVMQKYPNQGVKKTSWKNVFVVRLPDGVKFEMDRITKDDKFAKRFSKMKRAVERLIACKQSVTFAEESLPERMTAIPEEWYEKADVPSVLVAHEWGKVVSFERPSTDADRAAWTSNKRKRGEGDEDRAELREKTVENEQVKNEVQRLTALNSALSTELCKRKREDRRLSQYFASLSEGLPDEGPGGKRY